jgi:hypothetical protein
MEKMTFLTKLSIGVLVFTPSLVLAQVGFLAPSSAMDTLSGGSTGGGTFGGAIGRANSAVGAASNAGATPFDRPAAPYDPAGGGFFGGAASPTGAQTTNFNTDVLANIDTLKAWGGERIICRKTGEILQDGREISILATATGNYFDDGQNGNDAAADDRTYTNITINDTDYISPEAHYVKSKIIQTLQFVSPPPETNQIEDSVEEGIGSDLQGIATRSGDLRKYLFSPRKTMSMTYFQNLTPMQFSGVQVATTEPLSPLPKMLALESKQDEKLRDWGETFLKDYRLEPDKFESAFIQTFMPPPPRAPNTPLPASFTPHSEDDEEGGSGAGGGSENLIGGSAAGDPMGGASSRYF